MGWISDGSKINGINRQWCGYLDLYEAAVKKYLCLPRDIQTQPGFAEVRNNLSDSQTTAAQSIALAVSKDMRKAHFFSSVNLIILVIKTKKNQLDE